MGGTVINSYAPILETVKNISRKRAFSNLAENISIHRSCFGDHASVIGGGSLAIQYLFDNPEKIMRQTR